MISWHLHILFEVKRYRFTLNFTLITFIRHDHLDLADISVWIAFTAMWCDLICVEQHKHAKLKSNRFALFQAQCPSCSDRIIHRKRRERERAETIPLLESGYCTACGLYSESQRRKSFPFFFLFSSSCTTNKNPLTIIALGWKRESQRSNKNKAVCRCSSRGRAEGSISYHTPSKNIFYAEPGESHRQWTCEVRLSNEKSSISNT